MASLSVAAERVVHATPEDVWELVSDVTRYPEFGPWSAAGYQRPGAESPRGPGAVQWLRSSRRKYLRYATSIEQILVADAPQRLVYRLLRGIPMRNYRAEVTLAPVAEGTLVRWSASCDRTLSGRVVMRVLRRETYPQVMAGLAAAAERHSAARQSR